jgi:hypothetical protein
VKNSKLFFVAMLILPWLTLPLLGRNTFKRFLPGALFICGFTKILDIIGQRNNWWKFYKGIPPMNSMDFFNLGPYFASSFWVLKWTFGKFLLYLLFNTIFHILFILVGLKYTKQYKILSLVKLKKFPYLVLHFFRALLLYAFQYIKENIQWFPFKIEAKKESQSH